METGGGDNDNKDVISPHCQSSKTDTDDVNLISESSISKRSSDNKDDVTKLSDSACESMNDSELDSAENKVFDNEICDNKNPRNADSDESEKDSLVCETNDGIISDSDSIDNSTFNILPADQSESQEISELANDESSSDIRIENGMSVQNIENGKPQMNARETLVNWNDDKEVAKLVEQSTNSLKELSEYMNIGANEFNIESNNDKVNHKLSDESIQTCKQGTDDSTKCSALLENKELSLDSDVSRTSSNDNSTQACNIQPQKESTKHKKNDFKIEIYESKKRPNVLIDLIILNQTSGPNTKSVNPNTDPVNPHVSPPNSDKPFSSSEPLSSSPDSTNSFEKTSSAMLDISQAIKEESEESDVLSPIQNSLDEQIETTKCIVADTTRKVTPEPKPSKPETKTPQPVSNSTKNPPSNPTSTTVPSSSTSESSSNRTQDASGSIEQPSSSSVPSGTSAEVPKKPSPMAFTVELGDSAASDSSGSGSTAAGKKLDISASLSQWVPKHRRNLSLTKVEEHKKGEERQGGEKPPMGRPRSGTVGATGIHPRKGGYHSEGYFSSDQEEENARKSAEPKCPRSPRTHDTLRSPPGQQRPITQDSKAPLRMRPESPSNSYSVPLNESATVILEKVRNGTPETKRKHPPKPEGRTCCKERDRKPLVSELTGRTIKSEKNQSCKAANDACKDTSSSSTEVVDLHKEDKDDASETGTYTIDKDSPSLDVEDTRNDIERIFGIPTESEAEMTSSTAVPTSTTDVCPDDETSWMSASEVTRTKPPAPGISRNSPNWIQQWAAQVAEQTKPSLEPILNVPNVPKLPSLPSPRGGAKPLMISHSPPHESDGRPRRKLPTPPVHQLTPPSPNPSKGRARVDMAKNPAFRNCSFESHESGADSDFDTSSSYPFHDDDRLAASLRSKLRLSGLESSPKKLPSPTPPRIPSPRRMGALSSIKRDMCKERVVYDSFGAVRGEHSDTSSDASEPYSKDHPKTSDNNPPLKFNRAFSLRRARLGFDEPTQSHPVDRKKTGRPSSAGAASSNRRAPLGATKSYQSVDSSSVSSPRGYNNSPKRMPSKNVSSLDNLDRTDGGRFSLRLARSASAAVVSKSPSKIITRKEVSSKKSAPRSNSTLSSKEVDFQNWKRRKNYDPMRAAAEGRKKQSERKNPKSPQVLPVVDDRSPSPPGSLLRSASFHGTDGVPPGLRWSKQNSSHHQYTSEDDGPYSAEEEHHMMPLSPLRRSPTSPHQLCPSASRPNPASNYKGRRSSVGYTEDGEALPVRQSPSRKVSLEESGSEGKRSPLSGGAQSNGSRSGGCVSGALASSGRPKTKMEALDNLVISTIHSLSVKVRATSESLLQKLKSQYDEEGDRAALLDEVLSHLSESDHSLTSGQTRSTSRELAGTLRNLKKIEHALEVMDRVILVGDEDYIYDDQMDDVPNEWIESDY